MSSFKLTTDDNNIYFVEGDLKFLSITKESIKSFNFLNSSKKISINLSKVKHADSGGMALLIEWIKHSKIYQTQLSFINIPEQLLTLARLSGFEINDHY
ncbi:MAG: STAS domain-containing protein [Methylococcales symbiont of Iophon sp. n. MRB-2018]|nr:MAG: STAS domain-containing protein [Methylococcales symbiont of Iophon sp. n. MRB-2018]KAF3980166.1 MAG: STAS domain-containing protein [Methylococcales symbiont of Iophon sp. n. MRB-2018]